MVLVVEVVVGDIEVVVHVVDACVRGIWLNPEIQFSLGWGSLFFIFLLLLIIIIVVVIVAVFVLDIRVSSLVGGVLFSDPVLPGCEYLVEVCARLVECVCEVGELVRLS